MSRATRTLCLALALVLPEFAARSQGIEHLQVAPHASPPRSEQPMFPPVQRGERIVIVAPHPDDEVLGCGGLIQQAIAAGGDVRVIYMTNGDNNPAAFKLYKRSLFLTQREYLAFGEKRHAEARAAMTLLGLPMTKMTFLGYPDWGTLGIWRDHWGDDKPFRSGSTGARAVPYLGDFAYGHPYRGEAIEADLVTLFRQWNPSRILVTHPCDTNPDHRGAANFVRLALLDLAVEGLHPQLWFYLVHFGLWPRPTHYHPDAVVTPPPMLLDDGNWFSQPVTAEQTENKYNAILCNRTQTTTREYFLVSFARANELFATIDQLNVVNLPADVPLDWKHAVRNKALGLTYTEPTQKLDTRPHPATTIALEQTEFLRQGDDLIAAIEFKNRLGPRSNVHLLVYGYRAGTDFGSLPKLGFNFTPIGVLHVFNDGKPVPNHGVTATIAGNRVILRMPLKLLGPETVDHLFTATRANLGEINADDTAWRLFTLSDKSGAGRQGSSLQR